MRFPSRNRVVYQFEAVELYSDDSSRSCRARGGSSVRTVRVSFAKTPTVPSTERGTFRGLDLKLIRTTLGKQRGRTRLPIADVPSRTAQFVGRYLCYLLLNYLPELKKMGSAVPMSTDSPISPTNF